MVDRRIPETEARLSISAYFQVEVEDADGNTVVKKLGSIEQFREGNPRRTEPRYQFDDDDPGDIVERIPVLVDRTLNIDKAVLYNKDLIQAFGSADMTDIIEMKKPFVIIKHEKYPESLGGGQKVTRYEGCWFHDNPKTYNLTGALKIVQSAEIGYTRRRVTSRPGVDEGADGSRA